MPVSNTNRAYGSVAKFFHWLIALLILAELPLGMVANDMAFDTAELLQRKALLFSIHKTLGVTIFFVALARIFWALTQPKPGLLNAENRIETIAADLVHWLLYGALVLVPLTGWMHHAATTGFAPIWWPLGQSLPFVPKDDGFAQMFAAIHSVSTKVLIACVALHIAGALKHHLLDKDATLRRMLPGAAPQPEPPLQHGSKWPRLAAVIIWVSVLAVGAAIGIAEGVDDTAKGQAQNAVTSDWVIQEGSIDISVTVFGSPVTGHFADWTADITFEEGETPGIRGHVEVTVAIASLSLGSVTQQALGPDYFDAATFPTARFMADIRAVPDGYSADGTLTVKDKSVPVALFFTLYSKDGVSKMNGDIGLDRRDFVVGDNMPDETSLKFGVEVDVSVTAAKVEKQ
jgi:cytochrome b561/polyisoprenoid-binding protein YceI